MHALKAGIIHFIEKVDDEHFLKVVHAMLDTYVNPSEKPNIVGYDIEGKPLLADDLEQIYASRVEAMKQGKAISITDLKKDVAEW